MRSVWNIYIVLASVLSIMSMSNAATLFVESLDDTLGSAATLRQTIINASSGDTIQFNVSGTITLDETLGQLVIDKELIIDGQNKISIDGADQINVCFFITGLPAERSEINNITIQNFNGHSVNPGSGTATQELPAHGILIDLNAGNCSINNTTINHITSGIGQTATGITSGAVAPTHVINTTIESISSEDNASGNSGTVQGINANILGDCIGNSFDNLSSGTASVGSGDVSGIQVFVLTGDCQGNTVSHLVSGSATGDSGNVYGVLLFSTSNCLENSISSLSSGAAGNAAGEVVGIFVNRLEGNCLNNAVSDITGTGVVGGIRLSSIDDDVMIACNTVSNVIGEGGILAFGFEIASGDRLAVYNNSITLVVSDTDESHGLLLGSTAENDQITNSEIFDNVILNIDGAIANGYGITIRNSQSVGNDLLQNSISRINGAAINYEGVPTDGNVELSFITCSGPFITVSGTLFPEMALFGDDFLIQFFVSTLASPVQTQLFIGQQVITAGNGITPFSVTFEPSRKIFESQFITATATALRGSVQNINTSVVSNALFGCTTSMVGLCNIVTICPNEDTIPVPVCPVQEMEMSEVKKRGPTGENCWPVRVMS